MGLDESADIGPGLGTAHRVLFLDDDPDRADAFLRENPEAVWVETVEACVGRLGERWDEVHLDHDLGGQTFVDSAEKDCGMEVIRWLCSQPCEHLHQTHFIVHTHNSLAGLLMVLQMRSRGYHAEFRPFGVDPARFLAGGDAESFDSVPEHADRERLSKLPRVLRRLVDWLKRGHLSSRTAPGEPGSFEA
jgi:hypothetical protein